MRFYQDLEKLADVDPRWRKFVNDQYDDQRFTQMHEHRMRSRQIDTINAQINLKRRAVVSLGCSFTQGQSAFPEELVQKLRPRGGNGSNFDYSGKGHDIDDMLELATEYLIPLKVINDSIWNQAVSNLAMHTSPLEIDNAFVNHFATEHDYVPINMGHNGNGNMAAINRLFQYPIDWHLCDDIIVLWCYSDQHRYDLQNDDQISYTEIGGDHFAMWPKYNEYNPDLEKFHAGTAWHNTQWYFTKTVRSEAFSYLNHIDNGIKLDTWCKANNAKLLTFGSFCNIDRSQIESEFLDNRVIRDPNRIQIDGPVYPPSDDQKFWMERYLNKFPWHSVVKLREHDSFLDLAIAQETKTHYKGMNMWEIIQGGGTEDDWIFPCGHPSGKAHKLLADELSNIATEVGIIK